MGASSRWLAAGLLALAALACPGRPEEAGAEAAEGERLYAALECAGCHEYAALPGMVVRPLGDLASRYDVDSLTAFLASPTPPMPVFPISEEQRRQLATYLLRRFP